MMLETIPVDSAFYSSIPALDSQDWSFPTNMTGATSTTAEILILISIILFIASLNKFINILPYMLGCLLRWKECLNIENSMKVCRNRNAVAGIMLIPFILTTCKYRIWPSFLKSGLDEPYLILATLGIFIGYISIRAAGFLSARNIKGNKKILKGTSGTSLTFFCTATVIITITSICASVFDLSWELIRSIILYEFAVLYAIMIIRKTQIFINYCSVLSTILYLCTLEILPTAILIVTAVLI